MRVFASFCKKKGFLFLFEKKNQKTSACKLRIFNDTIH
jgi:hypothetical protein